MTCRLNKELSSKYRDMTDAKLITYCEIIHITTDSRELVEELIHRIRKLKRELYEVHEIANELTKKN